MSKILKRSAVEIGTYTIPEAAHYLALPQNTVRYWVHDPDIVRVTSNNLLSFTNLIELHVLKGMRKLHRVPLQRIRRALQHVQDKYPSPHPLADRDFETDGVDIFLKDLGQYINVSRKGQGAFREIVSVYLKRIGRDAHGIADQLYPFVLQAGESEPRHILITPKIGFGKPVLAGTGISTAVIAGRFNARESISDLAREYGRKEIEIEEAIRWENRHTAAA